jgi:predicted nucleic acid-binding protein
LTRYLLDTNIISDALKPAPSPKLEQWMRAQQSADLFIATMSLAVIWRGILLLPEGKKRNALATWFAGPTGPHQAFATRILSFDDRAAMIWGRLMSDGAGQGLSLDVTDMIIAAIAEANDCMVVTANARDFRTVPFFNPMAA